MPIVKNEADKDKILSACQALHSSLAPAGVRSKLDDRLDRSPGFKFNDYEMRVCPSSALSSACLEDAGCTWLNLELRCISYLQPVSVNKLHMSTGVNSMAASALLISCSGSGKVKGLC